MNAEQTRMFLTHIYVRADAYRLLGVLKTFLERYLFAQEGQSRAEALRDFLESHSEDPQARSVLTRLPVSFFEGFTTGNVYAQLEDMRADMATLPVATLYVPVVPSPFERDRIGAWFRAHVGNDVLLVFRRDMAVSGGCGLVWKSVYFDLSFRYFAHMNRERIRSMIESYGRRT